MERQGNGYEYSGRTNTTLPSDTVPVKIEWSNKIITRGPASRLYPIKQPQEPNDFTSYIATLDDWEQELLQDVIFDQDVFSFTQYLKDTSSDSGTKIFATSDGSAPDFVGSFGWACKSTTRQLLATNKGPAHGYRTTSYRAEAYGLLSFLVCVHRSCEFTGTTLNQKLYVHSDSESVLKKLDEIRSWSYSFQHATMCADWDVLQAIIALLETFDNKIILIHVKGHQDDTKQYHELSLEAQLNVDADKLASEFSYKPRDDPGRVPLTKGSKILLHSKDGTITSNYRKNIRKLASYPIMKKHICKKENWSDQEFDMIDWKLHGLCVRKNYNRKHFTVKFIHDWLPLGSLVSYYKGNYSTKCPSCDHEFENRDHFLLCESRREWNQEALKELRRFLKKHPTRPALIDILLEALTQWFEGYNVKISGFPDIYDDLIKNQATVGWEQILYGRFVKEWAELQHEFLMSRPNRNKKHSATTWISGITMILWNNVYHNWEWRNLHQHGVDNETREGKLAERAIRQTEELYKSRRYVLPRHQKLFYESIEIHQEKEPTSKGLSQWINTWQAVIMSSVEKAKKQRTQGIRSIENYFTFPNTRHQTKPDD